MPEVKKVEIGSNHTVIIEKLFGPLIFCDLRITPDINEGEWVVERQRIDGNNETTWEEMSRFDCQESIFFDD